MPLNSHDEILFTYASLIKTADIGDAILETGKQVAENVGGAAGLGATVGLVAGKGALKTALTWAAEALGIGISGPVGWALFGVGMLWTIKDIVQALAIADKLQALSEKCDDLEMARGPIGAQTGAYENPNPMGFADTPPTGGNPFSNPPGTNAGPGNVAGNFAGAFNNFDDNVPF